MPALARDCYVRAVGRRRRARDGCAASARRASPSSGAAGCAAGRARRAAHAPPSARARRPPALARREQPDHGRPRAAHERRRRRPPRAPARARSIAGTATTAAACRSLCSSSRAAGSGAPSSSAARSSSWRCSQLARARAPGRAGRPRAYTVGRRELGRERQHEHAERRTRSGSASQPLAGAASPASGPARPARARRRPAARRARAAARSSPSPDAGARQAQRRGRVGRAAAEPGGDRDALVDPQAQRRRVPAGRRAERRERARREVLSAGHAGAHDLVALARPAARCSSVSSSASEIDCITRDQLVPAVAARVGPTNRPRLIFAGASARSTAGARSSAPAPAPRQRPEVLRREPLGAHVRADGRARCSAVADLLARAPRRAARTARASRRASCAGARTRRARARAAPATAPRAARLPRRRMPTSTESTFGTG